MKSGFIQYCFYAFKRNKRVNGLWLRTLFNQSTLIPDGVLRISTFRENKYYNGHAFNPSLHRMSEYTCIQGGFSALTYFSSYGKGAGIS